MAVGFWRKVKNIASNAFSGIKKAATFANENIIKPLLPIAKEALERYGGGTGKAIVDGINLVSDFTDQVLPDGERTSFGDAFSRGAAYMNKQPVLSRRIQLK